MSKTYTVKRRGKTPQTADIDTPLWGGSFGISGKAELSYDDKALYVRLSATERDIRAELKEPLDQPCRDSCLEFFFSPVDGDSRYFNVEFNPNALMFLGFGAGRDTLIRLMPMSDSLFSAESRKTGDGWEIEYAIPHAFVRLFFPTYAPARGYKMHGNFYKCGDETKNEHYLSWNPVRSDLPDFHRQSDFGTIIFD